MKREFKIKGLYYLKHIDVLSKDYSIKPEDDGTHTLTKTHRLQFHLKSEKPIWFDLPIIIKTSILTNDVIKYQMKLEMKKMNIVWSITILICIFIGYFINFPTFSLIFCSFWLSGLIIIQLIGGRIMDKLEDSIKHQGG